MWHYIVVRKLYVAFQNEDASRPSRKETFLTSPSSLVWKAKTRYVWFVKKVCCF